MKTNQIISFTLINALILLGFASVLASCQKKLYPSHGHLKHTSGLFSKKSGGRTIASVQNQNDEHRLPITNAERFLIFQDPSQIYIYCTLNSKEKESCYSDNLKKSVKKYEEKFGKLGEDELNGLLDSLSLENVQSSTQLKVDEILTNLEPNINKSINNQHKFCKENSKHFFKKCMEQSLDKDTFKVLNSYQRKNQMNGQEYLYLKDAIHAKFAVKTDDLKTI